ncbi:MAG: formylglycine-generating enzyme family protein [Bdellovibrionales bacterium]
MAASAATPPSVVAIPSGALAPFWITTKDKSGQVEPLKIKAFEAMVLPVTNKQFLEFLKSHPEWRRSKVKTLFADDGYLKQFQSDLKLRGDVTKDSPVTNVSWFAAQAYCEGLGMRLPTMAEWEYLAAASETKTDASQDPAFLRQILEWYSQPQESTTLSKVGRRPKNLYGLHDLHGLIWEWVYDFNSSLVAGEGRTESSLNRELFCGSGAMAGGNKENYAAFMRFAFRSSLKGASTTWNLGFRCVKGES